MKRDPRDYLSHPEPDQCDRCDADALPGRGLCRRHLDILNGDLVEDEQQVTNVLDALCDAASLASRTKGAA